MLIAYSLKLETLVRELKILEYMEGPDQLEGYRLIDMVTLLGPHLPTKFTALWKYDSIEPYLSYFESMAYLAGQVHRGTMKLILAVIFFLFPELLFAGPYDVTAPALVSYAPAYVLVGVAGFSTGKNQKVKHDIFSKVLASSSNKSGVWDRLPEVHSKIFKRVFLTHDSDKQDLQEVINIFLDENGTCSLNLGIIIMANSWGSWNANVLGKMYYRRCHRLPDVFVMIDGITKPFVGSFTRPVWAYNCINLYQKDSTLHGSEISNCANEQIQTDYDDLYHAHVFAEWEGSSKASQIIRNYLDEKLPPHWVKDSGVNYLNKLYDLPDREDMEEEDGNFSGSLNFPESE